MFTPTLSRVPAPVDAGRGGRAPDWSFRPDIEGLRAVAVVLVVAYHVGLPLVPGGFVGVDVFFVVSGFLITGMLMVEWERTGSVSLRDFYARRARRLVPAASLVLLVTLAGAWLVWPATGLRDVAVQGAAAAAYAVNMVFAADQAAYLQESALPSPLLQLWSLAVEEQFYLLFPLLVLVVAVRWGARAFAAAVVSVAVASFALCVWLTGISQPWAFFSLPARAWELLAGAGLALALPWVSRVPALARDVLVGAGLGLVLLAAVRLDEQTLWPGAWALLPVLGTLAVIAGGVGGLSASSRLLALPPLRSVGRWSYSWYLWHWPLLVLPAAWLGRPLSLLEGSVAALVALGLAAATYAWVEQPWRARPSLVVSPSRSLAFGAFALAAVVGVAAVVYVLAPSRVTALASSASPAQVEVPADQVVSGAAPGGAVAVEAGSAAPEGPDLVEVLPRDLTPSLAEAKQALSGVYEADCVRGFADTTSGECVFGNPASDTTVVLFGDSHAANWFPAVEQVALRRDWRLVSLTKAACPPAFVVIDSKSLKRRYTECEEWREHALARIAAERPALVVLSGNAMYAPEAHWRASVGAGWAQMLARLTPLAGSLVVLGDNAHADFDPVECLASNATNASVCAPPAASATWPDVQAAVRAAALNAGAVYADTSEWMCGDMVCPVVVGNVLVFRDPSHLTAQYALLAAPQMEAVLERALPEVSAP